MTAVEPGGARVPANPERLAEAEAFTRGAVEYDATGALALFVAEYDRRGAALAAAASRNALNAGSAAEWVKQREKALAEVERLRGELRTAAAALCAVGKAALVVKPTLDKPYPDDERWTPWTRFMESPAREAYNLGTRLRRETR